MTKLFYLLLFLFLFTHNDLLFSSNREYVKAPYLCTIKKSFLKKRYGDITTTGRFKVFKVEFINKDIKEHFIDYSCFYLTDTNGICYEIHTEATIVRQTYYEDWRITDVDVIGLNKSFVKPNFKTEGILVFEIPTKGEYQLNFRGYLK